MIVVGVFSTVTRYSSTTVSWSRSLCTSWSYGRALLIYRRTDVRVYERKYTYIDDVGRRKNRFTPAATEHLCSCSCSIGVRTTHRMRNPSVFPLITPPHEDSSDLWRKEIECLLHKNPCTTRPWQPETDLDNHPDESLRVHLFCLYAPVLLRFVGISQTQRWKSLPRTIYR